MSSTLFARTALAAAVAIVAAAPALAQNTSAAIGGRVTTLDGKPVAGATVVVVHRESGSTVTLTTDAEGRFASRGLRVGGPYTVTVTKGADKTVNNEVYLALAETTVVDLRLGQQQLEAVVVTGAASANNKFSSSAMGSGTQLGRQELDAYASIQRNLQDYARTDPRLAQTDKERGEISAGGQNTRFNSITVDGVRINDTFGLEANNLPMLKQPISIDAIQAVQVNLSNYDVTQTGYTGANINAVTKSGTNELKGSMYYVYRDANMAGKRYNRNTDTYFNPPGFKEDTKGFTLGGPIIKDKLFFFASYEELASTRNGPGFGVVGGTLPFTGLTQAQVDAAVALAKSKYGMDIGGTATPAGVELTAKDTLLKLDWTISEKHRANVRYAKSEENNPIYPSTTSNTLMSLSSHWYVQAKTLESIVGQVFSDWTDNFSTELKISQRDYDSVPLNNSNLPQVSLIWNSSAAGSGLSATQPQTLRFGTENSRQFNKLSTKTSNTFFAANWILDDHEIKGGFDLEKNDIYNAFLQNTKGVYEFRQASPTSSNPNPADPLALWTAGIPTSYTVQLPLSGKALTDGVADWTQNNLGLFLQDTWQASSQLTLVGGVRIDRFTTDDRPIANAAASAAPTVNTSTGRAAGGFGYDNTRTMDGMKLFQPRLGFNYAFKNADKRKEQLRGGVGLFQGNAANVWMTNPFQNAGVATGNFNCNSATACASVRFSPNPDTQPVIAGTPPAPNVDFIAPNVKQPSVVKANLAYDAELPWHGLTFGAEWLFTDVKDGLYYRYLNLGAATAKAPDGRDMFWNAAGRDPNCWLPGGSTPQNSTTPGKLCSGATFKALNNPGFNNVTVVERTDKGGGNAVTLSLSQRPMPGLSWSLAYTRTSATEVSPLTSSTANSNWLNRAIYNPNEEVASNSAYLIRDRFSASVNFSKAFFGKYKTTVGVFYEGREGKPYSWTFNNDMNGDGVAGNDLLYIPNAPGSGDVLFKLPGSSNTVANSGAAAEAKFWDVVHNSPALTNARGGVVARNAEFSKFTNNIDLRISQEVPGFFAGHKGVIALDILNFGNMLDKRWGRIDEIGFGTGGNVRNFVNYSGIDPATGKMIYTVNDPRTFTTRQVRGESQWAVQVTARYTF
ncbi:TonB-dependent receptor [Inhella gelatinilytica]|uniref:TonB-dependent receptor n=1 Tax=Inhella gelatinilytica TaxID=2795030 RepID=A0A931IWL9_9BURK|nr:TonB-dependent receptor [Inhella gelatinilytica]MBH9551393.1 TonB-dependent receptor [Inhella gelatinilytica]